jgi:hypothetical protein
MKIQEKDIYYGVALTQIAESPTFTSINKVMGKNGLFQINNDKRILIKYSTSESGEWRFTFSPDDLAELSSGYDNYIVLICGLETICLLSFVDINELIDTLKDESQWIGVNYPVGGRMRVRGSLGGLSHTVAHDSFPKNLLGSVTKKQEDYAWPPFSKLNCYEAQPELI